MCDIAQHCRISWQNVSSKVNKAVVFLDDVCAECLHWNGGGLLLYNAGALDIKEFSSFESGGAEDRKAVFVISRPLHGTNMAVLRDILAASSFQYVILISTLVPAMHTIVAHGHGEDEGKSFIEAEEKLLQWMGNMNLTVEIYYMPVVSAPITDHLFVLPEHRQVFPLMPADLDILLPAISKEQKSTAANVDLNFQHLPKELQLSLKLLVCGLNSFLESVEISEDVYCLGHTSRIVATELANLPWAKNRRKKAKNKASLLIVDRSLDVANIASHNWDTMLDRILSLLPKLPGHSNDVCVDMAPVCAVHSYHKNTVIVPGCLAHPNDTMASRLLHVLAEKKFKESLMEVNRHLVEAASQDNVPIKLTSRPGRVTAEQIDSHLSQFKGQTKVVKKNKGLLQIVLAVLETTKHPKASQLDRLLAMEKGILQNIGQDNSASHIAEVISTLQKEMALPQDQRLYKLEDIFMLMVFIYSLLEDEDDEVAFVMEERNLQELLVSRIMEEKCNLPDFLITLVGENPVKETVLLILQDMFDKLKSLRRTREDLQQFNCIYGAGTEVKPATLSPLLKSVIETVLDPSKPHLSDIVYKSTGFTDILKSGFGLFMSVTKPRPSDHPLLIVYVIGGTTATEVRQIKEAALASKSNIQVVVGSTGLIGPADLLTQLYVRDHLHPQHSQ